MKNTQSKSIGIVIVNYNGRKCQNNCIKSIFKNSFQNFKIIVVDNNSSDDSLELLSEFNDDRIVIIRCDDNFGIAKGNNIGIKKSKELGLDYTLLLNNDTILKENLLDELLDNIDEECVCTPKMYCADGKTIWYGGGTFVKYRGNTRHTYYLEEETSETKYEEFQTYAPTTCMLIPNTFFDEVGLIDEKYFLYFDDVDFCFRLLKSDRKIKLCSNTSIIHLVGQSSGGDESKFSIYYMTRNKFYFLNKFKKDFNIFIRCLVRIDKRLKCIKGKMKKNNYAIIGKAISDYKHKRMGRCDTL